LIELDIHVVQNVLLLTQFMSSSWKYTYDLDLAYGHLCWQWSENMYIRTPHRGRTICKFKLWCYYWMVEIRHDVSHHKKYMHRSPMWTVLLFEGGIVGSLSRPRVGLLGCEPKFFSSGMHFGEKRNMSDH
jgi:hypothetical protein